MSIDYFCVAVSTANKHKGSSRTHWHFDALFIELGAIRDRKLGDDLPDGEVTDFRRGSGHGRRKWWPFSWVEWRIKATRDAAMKKMIEDPRMDPSTPAILRSPSTASA